VRKSKRKIPNVHEWREICFRTYTPKEPEYLKVALQALESGTHPLNEADKHFAENWIRVVTADFLKFRAQADASPSSGETLSAIRRRRKTLEQVRRALENADFAEVLAISLGNGKWFDRFLGYFDTAIENLKFQEDAHNRSRSLARTDKLFLLASCRDLMKHFNGGHRPGHTKDGPLTRFAEAVFRFATGTEEGFERQVKCLPLWDEKSRNLRVSIPDSEGDDVNSR